MKKHNFVIRTTETVLDSVETASKAAEHTVDTVMNPVRKTVFSRFPVLFMLLVAFGGTATFLGFELLLIQMPFLYERPWLISAIGVTILILTGRLYKKLE